jgi:protein-tyrosine phosphatase
MIERFCQDASNWLEQDDANVVVVHCKAGKGRTGVMIASLLLYMGVATDSQQAITMYGSNRTKNGKVILKHLRPGIPTFSISLYPYLSLSLFL